MLIPESMAVYFLGGAAFGAFAALFILFLIGLLYRLDCVHFYADEVDFEKPKPKLSVVVKKGG
jgi:hypothetical protein